MNSRQCNFQCLIPALIFIAGTIFISGKLLPELPLFITDNGNKYMVMRNFAEHGSLTMAHGLPLLWTEEPGAWRKRNAVCWQALAT